MVSVSLVIVGFTLLLSPLYAPIITSGFELQDPVQYVSVSQMDPEQVDQRFVVGFENMSADDQDTFLELLNTDERRMRLSQIPDFMAYSTIEYEDRYYDVSIRKVSKEGFNLNTYISVYSLALSPVLIGIGLLSFLSEKDNPLTFGRAYAVSLFVAVFGLSGLSGIYDVPLSPVFVGLLALPLGVGLGNRARNQIWVSSAVLLVAALFIFLVVSGVSSGIGVVDPIPLLLGIPTLVLTLVLGYTINEI